MIFIKEENKIQNRPHNVIIENRKKIIMTGIKDVLSFDEKEIIALTDIDEILIKGFKLHIINLNLETGDLSIDGEITSLNYLEGKNAKGGLFSRLFK